MFRNLCFRVQSIALLGAFGLSAALAAQTPGSLKDAYKGDFLVGAALDAAQIEGKDARADAIVLAQFNTISPANALKWARVHPKPGKYRFKLADRYVAFGREHHMFVVGHNLVWHNQVPGWVFRDDKGQLLTRDALLQRLKEHIQTVVGRYKGQIQSWDVVNEALDEDGSLRQSLWLKIIGPDYIEKAFEYAHEADPQAQLTYNDYNLEKPAKREGAIRLVKKLQAEGIPIASVGLQNHDSLTWPSAAEEDATIKAFAALGVKVVVSELDVNVLPNANQQPTADVSLRVGRNKALNPYRKGLPDSVQQQLARRYADLFRVFLANRATVARVTFWDVTDGDSWLNNWPVKGRTNYPLLFDRQGKPKPAYDAVLAAADRKP